MSAELLREAASKMRERAEAATESAPAPWSVDPITTWGSDHEVRDQQGNCIAFSETGHNASLDAPVAEHIASMHPAVALAVADWLEGTASVMDEETLLDSPESGEYMPPNPEALWCERCGGAIESADYDEPDQRCECFEWARAFSVARAYLGSDR